MMLKPMTGRLLSAAGAAMLIVALFLVWYHVDRDSGVTTTSTGWETFPRLRMLILVGAVLTLATALVAQRRWVLLARTALGLVLAVLIMRRIIDPPDIADPISAQLGVFIGFVGALAVALGGLVDSGRRIAAEGLGGIGLGRPLPELPPGNPRDEARRRSTSSDAPGGGAVVRVRNHASEGR
jgi:small-conductance mechanosensitive channel